MTATAQPEPQPQPPHPAPAGPGGAQLPCHRQAVEVRPEAVAGVRRDVSAYVRLWGYEELADWAALCTSELLSNVGKHTDCTECVLSLERQSHGVRVTVSDGSPVLPALREPDWAAEDGRGLLVLAGVADAWGAVPTGDGKDVWVELRTPGAAVCGERVGLPPHLLDAAMYFVPPPGGPGDVERDLRCTLEGHRAGDHHALVMDLPDPAGALWTSWTRGRAPAAILILPDCPDVSPADAVPCCEFAGHPGGHTWQLRP